MYILEECTEIKDAKFGKGLFAMQNIDPDISLCSIRGQHISFKQTLLLGERKSHAIQIGNNDYILCEPPFLYSNHSCTPNCGINSSLELVTLKNISAGEELF
jgi:hypothetical protein